MAARAAMAGNLRVNPFAPIPSDSRGEALLEACSAETKDSARALSIVAAHGEEVLNYRNRRNIAPIQMAIVNGLDEVAIALVEKLSIESLMDSTSSAPGENAERPCLSTACRAGRVAVVEALLRRLPYEGCNQCDRGGATALLEAVMAGADECVRILCERLEAEDILAGLFLSGKNILHFLAQEADKKDLLLTVLSHIPDERIMKADALGMTPLHYAVQFPLSQGATGQPTLAQRAPASVQDGQEREACSVACGLPVFIDRASHEQLIAITDRGQTALHIAVRIGNSAAALALMSVLDDEDLAITDNSGRTPLHEIRFSNDTRVVDTLLRRVPGAMSKRANDGSNPLHALFGGFQAPVPEVMVVERMLQETPPEDLVAVNQQGLTPLHYCASPHRSECLDLLLKFDVASSLGVQDSMGCTPIHKAAERCRTRLLEKMIAMAPRHSLALVNESGLTAKEVYLRYHPGEEEYAEGLFQPRVKSAQQ